MIHARSGAGLVRAAGLVACALGFACSSDPPLRSSPGSGVAVPPETALAFYQRAELFYARLLQRRFNTLETFNDPILRDHFGSIDIFFDYYASLAQALADAHFQKSRPMSVDLQEFLFEEPDRARVQVRFQGKDARPLRTWKGVAVIREDRWERSDGVWRLTPGRL